MNGESAELFYEPNYMLVTFWTTILTDVGLFRIKDIHWLIKHVIFLQRNLVRVCLYIYERSHKRE